MNNLIDDIWDDADFLPLIVSYYTHCFRDEVTVTVIIAVRRHHNKRKIQLICNFYYFWIDFFDKNSDIIQNQSDFSGIRQKLNQFTLCFDIVFNRCKCADDNLAAKKKTFLFQHK